MNLTSTIEFFYYDLSFLVNTPLFPEAQRNSGPLDGVISRIDSMARRWKADVEQQRNTVFKRREALQ